MGSLQPTVDAAHPRPFVEATNGAAIRKNHHGLPGGVKMEKSVNASTIITPEKAEHVLSNLRKQFHRALAEFNKSSSRKERLEKIQNNAEGLLKTLGPLDVKGADAVLTVLVFLKTLDASQIANSN
jgi:hypothetical protein